VQEQAHLLELTGLKKRQLKNWFTNARRRIWKPLVLQRQRHSSMSEAEEGRDHHGLGSDLFDGRQLGPAAGAGGGGYAVHTSVGSRGRSVSCAAAPYTDLESGKYSGEGALGTIFMSLAEFENPSRKHSFEVPLEFYVEDTNEKTAVNRRVVKDAVAVAAKARCLMCTEEGVDVQAVPCQHLLHTRCLRKWMQAQDSAAGEGGGGGSGQVNACCPVCSLGVLRVVLAVPCVQDNSPAARAHTLSLADPTGLGLVRHCGPGDRADADSVHTHAGALSTGAMC
jgi:hypothetical protein